jgi:hypothetical protein
VEEIIEAKQKEYIAICEKKAVLDKKADFRAKSVLALGSCIVMT